MPIRSRDANSPETMAGHRRDHGRLVWFDLCDAARRLGLEVREERLPEESRIESGQVRVGEKHYLVVEMQLPQQRKNELLVNLLRMHGVERIYLPPYLREWLDAPPGAPALISRR
jgi:uncharacterized protein YecE (DUF72 family)